TLEMLGGEFHFVLVAAPEREQCDAAQRGIFELLAEFEFLFVKAGEIVPARELNGRMIGRKGLHKHLAFDVTASRATRDLREQLKRPLARAKIRLVQGKVRINDPDERDVGKMQALGDHLRTDED